MVMTTEAAPATQAEIDEIFERVKNWGRWGPEDERGALNFITPAVRQRAAATVQDGVTVSCALPLNTEGSAENASPVTHLMVRAGDIPEASGTADYFAIAPHGMSHTHLDALCHIFYQGRMYNGFPAGAVLSSGATRCAITAGEQGIVSRGVLLDIPALRGLDWLEPGDPIHPADLDAAAERQGVQVDEGDILLVRTGRHRRNARIGPSNAREAAAGLHASCLTWLHEKRIAVLGCDGVSDVLPSRVEGVGLPIHFVAIPGIGLHLIDNAQLDDLADACAERRRWAFLLTLAPLRLMRGTASPINPIAVF
jgi:kynurenine formamidase